MRKEKNKATELGELCEKIGKKLMATPIENLDHEELVQGKKSGKLFIDYFKLKVHLDDGAYQVYGKFKDMGGKGLSIAELMIVLDGIWKTPGGR